jgi:hypothetical protein
VPLIHKPLSKIILADLCPEEKAKVGELIRTLESRREDNERLSTECQELS